MVLGSQTTCYAVLSCCCILLVLTKMCIWERDGPAAPSLPPPLLSEHASQKQIASFTITVNHGPLCRTYCLWWAPMGIG